MSSTHMDRLLTQLDARDREYIESLPDSERAVVASTILRYQRADSLEEGDPIPRLALHRADDAGVVQLTDFFGDGLVVLVFGSYT